MIPRIMARLCDMADKYKAKSNIEAMKAIREVITFVNTLFYEYDHYKIMAGDLELTPDDRVEELALTVPGINVYDYRGQRIYEINRHDYYGPRQFQKPKSILEFVIDQYSKEYRRAKKDAKEALQVEILDFVKKFFEMVPIGTPTEVTYKKLVEALNRFDTGSENRQYIVMPIDVEVPKI